MLAIHQGITLSKEKIYNYLWNGEYLQFAVRHTYIKNTIGKKQIAKITKADCQKIINEMVQDGKKHSTMSNLKSCLNIVFECALDDDIIAKLPYVDDSGNIRGQISGFMFFILYGNVWSEPGFRELIKRIIKQHNKEAEENYTHLTADKKREQETVAQAVRIS